MELLQNDRVRYANQPIAVVIAETLEAATEGAALLAPALRAGARARRRSTRPKALRRRPSASASRRGRTWRCRGRRSQPPRTRSRRPTRRRRSITIAMEPHAIVAAWDGDTLSIDTPSQGLAMAQGRIAGLFGIAPENIHIRSPFLGGGFGSKGLISGPQILGILAAKLVGRPGQARAAPRADVRPGRPSRADAGRRCASAPTADGRLTAHRPPREDRNQHLRRFLRAGGRCVAHALCQPGHRDVARGGADRHRHAAVHARARRGDRHRSRSKARSTRWRTACGMDPLAFRLKNYAEVEPITGKPFSSKALRECYAQGAERFGWASGRSRRARCATRTACWSAGAWAPRPSRR